MTDAPVPRRASEILDDLVACADRVLQRPHLAFAERAVLEALLPEINRAARTPCDDRRLIDLAAVILAQALIELAHGGDRLKWGAIAHALAPWVRLDCAAAHAADLRMPTMTGRPWWQ